ncbi:MAG: EAL domain-containing protein [Acidobacteria bacterium]|nr:EAL domain-containing protein [Acidobacteriota bacterium]MBV9478376.1 EAL domain-containing protein [Acidobacteriota bacterium]
MQPIEILVAAALLAAAVLALVRQLAASRSERALRDSDRFASEILENAGEGIVVCDRDLRYVLWNRFMEELSGMTAEDVIGRSAPDLFPHIREQHVDELLRRALAGETVSSPDIHYYVPGTGREGWISSVYRPHSDAAGNIIGVIGLIRDITERKSAEQQIEYQAYHDALTGLANRRLFQEHLSLALALAQRRHTLVAVLFLDLDHFKLVNDSLGHSVGDALLRQVAKRLKAAVREGDTVARVGGDEFTIVLQELSRREDAALVAQAVLRCVSEPIEVNEHKLYVTTSIGITVYPDDGEDAEALLKNADTAMYRAKSEGRNTFQMSTQELSRTTHERMTVENGLHRALEAEEFELLYQPQIEIATMNIVGMEALLRWRHPQRGVIAPEDFIGVAEERGLILDIGQWVIREACRAVRQFQNDGRPHFRVAVNISARQFRDPSLMANIEEALAESRIDPRTLELEITETVAMEDVELTMSTLARLRSLGITIAIDDFGTGHSSLSYIKRFPIDALKIDKGFVADLPDGFEDAAIVSSVIQLANGLGLRVVAEGVERHEQLEFLRDSDCREVQGFYFSYPVPLDEIEKLLSAAPAQ